MDEFNNAIENQDAGLEGTTTDVGTQDTSVQDTESQKYKIDDGEYTIEEIKQWREDALNKQKWQKELTQKSQAIAEYRQWGDWLLDSNIPVEEKRKWFEQKFPKQAAKIEEQSSTPDDYIKKLEEKLNSLERKYEQDRQASQTRELQNQLAGCKDTYKDKWNDDIQELVMSLWVAKPNLYKTISEAAKGYFEKHEKLFSSQQKNWIDKKKEDATNPANMNKGGGVPSAKDTSKMTEKERLKILADDIFKGD